MAKQALVLNGFTGGINKDSDPNDLPSEGRGNDQLVTLKNMLADRGGKVVTANIKITSGVATTGTNNTSADELLIYNNAFYREVGLYKVGRVVNWSANTAISNTANTPTAIGFESQNDTAELNIEVSSSTDGSLAIFMGGSASQNSSTNPVFNDAALTSYAINDFVRSTSDVNGSSGSWRWGYGISDFGSFSAISQFPNLRQSILLTANANYDTENAVPSGTQNLIEDTSNGLKVLDGCEHVHGDVNNQATIHKNGTHTVQFINGASYYVEYLIDSVGNTGNLTIKIKHGATIIHSGVVAISGDSGTEVKYGFTFDFASSTTSAVNTDFTFGEGAALSLSSGGSSFVKLKHIKILSNKHVRTAQDSAAFVLPKNTTDVSMDFHSTAFDAYAKNQAQNVTSLGHLSLIQGFDSTNSTAFDPAIYFRVGSSPFTGATNGISGSSLDIANKDIFLEINVDPSEAIDTADFTELYVIADSDGTDYSTSADGDGYAKAWVISRTELETQGCWRQKGRIKLTSDSATYLGASLNESDIRHIVVAAQLKDGSTTYNNTPVFNLFELSIAESSSLGWSNSTIQLSQTDSRNNFESLPSNYTSTFSFGISNKLDLKLHKPSTGYKGKIYYQLLNESSTPDSSERFLLAEVDYIDGVTNSINNETTAWGGGTNLTLSYPSIPMASTFLFESGYPERTKNIKATWRTAAVSNRQVYIGNITQESFSVIVTFVGGVTDTMTLASGNWSDYGLSNGSIVEISDAEDGSNNDTFLFTSTNDDETTLTNIDGTAASIAAESNDTVTLSIREPDKILKAPPGKIYGFSDLNFVDLELGAGTINCLKVSGDRLLVFSDDSLIIVNIAQDYEFLEATIPGMGIKNNKNAVNVDEGVAFVNKLGVYYFDGERLNNLSASFIDTIFADLDVGGIAYDPKTKLILVWKDANPDEIFGYSLKTKSWVTELDISAFQLDTNSFLYKNEMYFINASDEFKRVDNTDTSTKSITLQTGRISCGNFAIQKSFIKLHLSLISPSNAFTIKFANGNATPGGSVSVDSSAGSGSYEIIIPAAYKNGKDITFLIEDADAPAGFEISDMQIVYRNRKVI